MNSISKNILYGLLLLGLVVAPFVGLYPVLVMKLLCFALFASAFNLLLGYTGLLSFGHAAFLGGSAYITGHALKVWGVPPELGLLIGTLAGAVLGWLVGSLAIRRQGIYFTMITLALAQMLFFFFLQMPFTGGEDGLQGVPRGKLLGVIDLSNDLTMYYFALLITVGAFLLIMRIVHSPFGQILKAIKENEPRAISLGYDTQRFKLLVFVFRIGRLPQDAGHGLRHLDGRALDDVGLGGADDTRGRPGHALWPAGGCRCGRGTGEQAGRDRSLPCRGDGH